VKAKRAKTARVYPAESDPRQAKLKARRNPMTLIGGAWLPTVGLGWEAGDKTATLAREFGPWVRGADGRWQRDRRKR